jgi:hypothetical protein
MLLLGVLCLEIYGNVFPSRHELDPLADIPCCIPERTVSYSAGYGAPIKVEPGPVS